MEQQSNGVERGTDYPWKTPAVQTEENDEKKYLEQHQAQAEKDLEQHRAQAEKYLEQHRAQAENDSSTLWKKVKSINEKEPLIWEVYNEKVTEIELEKHKETEDKKEKPYFRFYNDRAYIVYCWHKGAEEPSIDIHIWVSKHCSSEDYKLAAEKAEQLYLFLDEKPILHREIQLEESAAFHDYFKVEVRRRPKDSREAKTKYDKCSLLQFREEGAERKKKKQWMIERKFLQGNLCSDDVFVITDEYSMYLWKGKNSLKAEEKAAKEYIGQKLKQSSRFEWKATVEDDFQYKDHHVYSLFPTKGKMFKPKQENAPKSTGKRVFHLTNSNGKLLNSAIEGTWTISDMSNNSIYLFDTDSQLFVCIVGKVDYKERCRALFAAENFLMKEYPDREGTFHQPRNKTITLVNMNPNDPSCYFPLKVALRG